MNPLLPAAPEPALVLASESPRRAEILRMLGFRFEVAAAPIDEAEHAQPEPRRHVRRLALLKAQSAARGRTGGLFLGADTVVVLGTQILEKPASPAEALGMLQRLRGRWHAVYTGVALFEPTTGRQAVDHERTEVRFQDWDDAVLERYVATGECMDKAGAYAIQGLGALLVREIQGCFYNVMGLPVGCLVRLLERRRSEVESAG